MYSFYRQFFFAAKWILFGWVFSPWDKISSFAVIDSYLLKRTCLSLESDCCLFDVSEGSSQLVLCHSSQPALYSTLATQAHSGGVGTKMAIPQAKQLFVCTEHTCRNLVMYVNHKFACLSRIYLMADLKHR